ncbi:serine hydrolase domain-containing protein [Litorimonas sp. RW-G-Af-16]|uniref:serine hydrolase domain-containing protein n=1 Tax=Litorimonas sp. RW-G-Af-16 TaxID=3241168 RepID=UPI00390CA375
MRQLRLPTLQITSDLLCHVPMRTCLAILAAFCLSYSPLSATANDRAMPDMAVPSAPVRINTAEIDRRASLLMGQLEMTGMSIAIVENGEIVFAKGYGERLRDSGMTVTEDTIFRWASVSKGVAAHALLSFVEDGEISLNDAAEPLAPSLHLPPTETPVKLGHLLTHQVGLTRNAYDGKIEGGRSASRSRKDLGALGYICPPGTCHTYQNVAYDAMTEVIEGKAKLPYKTVVKQRIFDPLGMESASLTYEGLVGSKNWARPHSRFGDRINRIKPNYYRVPAAAGVNSSVKDLAKWMIAQMPGETIFPEARLTAIQTPKVKTLREQRFLNRRFRDLQNAHYGLGFRTYDYHGHKVVGHRGGVEGYRALMLFDPDRKAGIAMMWNSPHTRPIGLQMEFLDQLYGLPQRDWLRLNETG